MNWVIEVIIIGVVLVGVVASISVCKACARIQKVLDEVRKMKANQP
jgi:hypothetical protein